MNRLATLCLCVCLCLWLGACASVAPPAPAPTPFFHDALFAPPGERVDAGEVFALSDAMKRYLEVDAARLLRREGRLRGLIKALYDRGELKLEYDASITRNAAQAFDAKMGNCLSLVIMTAAFAKALDLNISYQSVAIDETWSRGNDIAFLNGHVNVTLGAATINARGALIDQNRLLTIDFLPAEDILGQRTRPIPEATVVAMYMNNRAAEALARGHVDDAYWWARGAVEGSPAFMPAFNTLGVVYLRHGDAEAAEAAFNHILAEQADNPQALANLATTLDRLGRSGQAQAVRERLARIEPDPPFKFFGQGIAAMRRGDYSAAKTWFEKEVGRADYNGEFHFWLGIAHLRLGEVEQARKQLAIALDRSTTRGDHDLYAAKLDHLRALQSHAGTQVRTQ